MHKVNDILEVTIKPIIYDGDSGGLPDHFVFTVRTLERLGFSAVMIEDKAGIKQNSLLEEGNIQPQETISNMCEKIAAGKRAQVTQEFMIIAKCESLITGAGHEDALNRISEYIGAGADAVMIHSKAETPKEIFNFCDAYKQLPLEMHVPLVAVPSTYSEVTEDILIANGVMIVIYANQLLRSAYPAMWKAAESILLNGRAKEADIYCIPIKEILNLI